MNIPSLEEIARRTGGRVSGNSVIAPGPDHSRKDGSMQITPSPTAPDGFVVHSFSPRDDDLKCKDYVRRLLGLPEFKPNGGNGASPSFTPKSNYNGEYAARIWEECVSAAGTLVETYLKSRGISIPIPDVLRFHPRLKHRDDGVWPAMVARVDHGNGQFAIHRTFLKPDGSDKAPVPEPKMMLARCAGGAVRLSEAGERLDVGEGIETCLSVLQATGRPVWSGLSAPGVKKLELPEIVREVTLLSDAGEAGEDAAITAGRKWVEAGLVVKIARPTAGHKDFNEMVKRSGDITKSVNEAKPLPVDVEAIAKIENLIEREQKINAEAVRVGCSKGVIKLEIRRQQNEDGDSEQPHWQVEPWETPVDGKELIDALVTRLEQHVMAPKGHGLTTALWILFAWTHDAHVHSPLLLVTSPEPDCGKSTLLGLVNYLVPHGLIIVDASGPVLFRMIECWHPTIIVDEADDVFRRCPDVRVVINSGWTRGAGVPRCHPDTHEPEIFSTFAPKAIGIKGLDVPATTLSRSIILEMERKLPNESVKSFTHQDDADLATLRQKLMRFAADNTAKLRAATPQMPKAFNNRLEANWKPLLAIAELCGNGEQARETAEALSRRNDEASAHPASGRHDHHSWGPRGATR